MKRYNNWSLNDYQEAAGCTLRSDQPDRERLAIAALGLAGEAGEVADMIKKHLGHGHVFERTEFIKELGDVLWYVAALASLCKIPLDEVATLNIEKLRKRYPNGFSEERSRNRTE